MAELLKEATLSKEFQRFRVFEKYMAALAESLTLKLRYVRSCGYQKHILCIKNCDISVYLMLQCV